MENVQLALFLIVLQSPFCMASRMRWWNYDCSLADSLFQLKGKEENQPNTSQHCGSHLVVTKTSILLWDGHSLSEFYQRKKRKIILIGTRVFRFGAEKK